MKALMVAGEASGDMYGSALAKALRERVTSLNIAAMGGPRMEEAGIRLLYDYRNVSVVGIFEVFTKLRSLYGAYSRLKDWILKEKPDFAVLIDFPDFNFRVARFLKSRKIPTFYFISPQVWAWRKKRVHFLRDHLDLMICILPFEEPIYRQAGVPVFYSGHPLVEMVGEEIQRQPAFPCSDRPLIGLMPGSREVEVRRHSGVLMEAARRIRERTGSDVVLIWPPSLDLPRRQFPSWVQIETTHRYAAMKSCDLLLAASGTSTLEAAILGTPLFIVYRVGDFSWWLGKALVRVPYYGLVNWIAQRKCIPEYIQSEMDPERLATDAIDILSHVEKIQQMKLDLESVVRALGPPGAMKRAADAILSAIK